MLYSLKELDGMSIDAAQALSFEERDGLLDLIIADRGAGLPMCCPIARAYIQISPAKT